MKIFPIKVEKAFKSEYKFIEWKIHNVCNHDCSFCIARHKDGSQRWFSLEQYKEYVDKLVEICGDTPFWLQLTGGEPTLYPDLIPLLEYIKSKGAMVSLISNGSRTIRWWQELKEKHLLDYLYITYHSEQTDDYLHIAEVLNLFHDEPIEVVCLITHVITSIDKGFEAQKYLLENTGSVITLKAMMIGDYDIYSLYTEEQIHKLKNEIWVVGKHRTTKAKPRPDPKYQINHKLKVTYNTGEDIILDAQSLMKQQKNTFLGWDCNIGSLGMRIDYDIVYRGVCEAGGHKSLNDPTLNFTDDYLTCTVKSCFCGTDMIATKILPEDKYPMA